MSKHPKLLRYSWSCALIALTAGSGASQASAQVQAAPSANERESDPQTVGAPVKESDIVVTGSRVKRDGYNAPTPETVLSAVDIARQAPVNIADFVNQLPQTAAAATPRVNTNTTSSGSSGSNFLNLRGLGANRTLVLLDGRRVVGADVNGSVDINTLPSALISRVDVVTGGASAAYGSDAVAGVVNFVLDTKFTGVKVSAEKGITTYGDDGKTTIDLAAGLSFAGGRGHVIVSGSYSQADGMLRAGDRPWYNSQKIIPNPAFTATNGQPSLIRANQVNTATATYGGIITNGVLRGTNFGQGGTYSPFVYGTLASGGFSIGGTPNDPGANFALENPLKQYTAFGRASFDFSDAFKIFAEFNYGDAVVDAASSPPLSYQGGTLSLKSNNAFLPAALQAQLAAAGQSTFTFGTFLQDVGRLRPRNERELTRYVGGVEGDLGGGWSYNIYGQYGETRVSVDARPALIPANFVKAVNAVRNASGAIVCAVNQTTVTDAACVPYNPFGIGLNSQAAISYVTGDSMLRLKLQQTVASGSVQGTPFSTWAGPVSVAGGFEYRREEVSGTSDALSQANGFSTANYKPTNGSYDVKEGFLETVVPLARDLPFFKVVDLNAAYRRTHYSTSGSVDTWKVGLSWEAVTGLRFRGTRSRDIRAPNLNDLFQGGVVSVGGTITDTKTGIQTGGITSTLIGSLSLKPEKADTLTLGVVLQPRALTGLSLSFDYYDIKIRDAIAVLTNQQIYDLCSEGAANLCSLLTRNAAGQVTAVTRAPTNVAVERERGFDIEASYRQDLERFSSGWDANLTLRVLASHVISRTVDNGLVGVEYAGQNGPVQAPPSGTIPKWKIVSSLVYDQGPFTGRVTARSVSSGVIDPAYTPAILSPTDNYVPGATYVDLGFIVRLPSKRTGTELFFNIDNVFDKDPVIVPPVSQQAQGAPINGALYDVLGRIFRLGAKIRF